MHPLLASFSVSLCLLLSLSLVGEYVETQMLCHAQFLPVHCLSVLASIRLYFSPFLWLHCCFFSSQTLHSKAQVQLSQPLFPQRASFFFLSSSRVTNF